VLTVLSVTSSSRPIEESLGASWARTSALGAMRWQSGGGSIGLTSAATGNVEDVRSLYVRVRSCSGFELGHGDDPVEGWPILLRAEPAGFHVEAFDDRGVEQRAGAVVGPAVGVAAAGG